MGAGIEAGEFREENGSIDEEMGGVAAFDEAEVVVDDASDADLLGNTSRGRQIEKEVRAVEAELTGGADDVGDCRVKDRFELTVGAD